MSWELGLPQMSLRKWGRFNPKLVDFPIFCFFLSWYQRCVCTKSCRQVSRERVIVWKPESGLEQHLLMSLHTCLGDSRTVRKLILIVWAIQYVVLCNSNSNRLYRPIKSLIKSRRPGGGVTHLTEWVPRQPKLHREALSHKTKQQQQKKGFENN